MTPQETKNRIEELERTVGELTRFMEQKKQQQISFPLDTASQKVINDIITP
jgi:hypothetical protein